MSCKEAGELGGAREMFGFMALTPIRQIRPLSRLSEPRIVHPFQIRGQVLGRILAHPRQPQPHIALHGKIRLPLPGACWNSMPRPRWMMGW